MQQLCGDVSSMEEKAPIPSRFESKARDNEIKAWKNAHKGVQDETEPEVFLRVKRSPFVKDAYGDT